VRSLAPLLMVTALAACQQNPKEKPAPAPAAPPVAKTLAADAAPAVTRAPAKARPGGPSEATCDKFTEHVGKFIAEGLTRPGASAAEKQYVEKEVRGDHEHTRRFCLEALEQPEIDCVLATSDFNALAGCERLRRQVPKDMLGRSEVNEADCERFFVRHRQFMLAEGTPAEKLDADKDQIMRTCVDKARPGTIACYITAQTYEEARRCP
jgi:hypothetical protein